MDVVLTFDANREVNQYDNSPSIVSFVVATNGSSSVRRISRNGANNDDRIAVTAR